MTTAIQLENIQQVYMWLLNFCLKSSVQAFQDGELGRSEAFSQVAIVVVKSLEKLKL